MSQYLAIDLKSFYASVECFDRGLDPLTTNLVVADSSKTEKTICLAVTPSMKAIGLGGRCRLFEVGVAVEKCNLERLQVAPQHHFTGESCDETELKNNSNLQLNYIIAPPRMARYLEVSSQIYKVYLRYVSPEDIFSYSVDEVFIDVTSYLKMYHISTHDLAVKMIRDVLSETGITATCGIGTNMYLAKIAMDIVAKKAPPDADGVRLAKLDEYSYKALLWDHQPLTDFWRFGKGIARKLENAHLYTMGDVAWFSLYHMDWFYKTFGIDAEILIDHAWGLEPTTMADVKAYQPESHSICDGQVLSSPYTHEDARIVVQEMAENVMYQLIEHRLVTDLFTLDIAYDRENCDKKIYVGKPKIDHYGREVPPPVHGSVRLDSPTNLGSILQKKLLELFDSITDWSLTIRKITITACNLTQDNGVSQLDLFADTEREEDEKAMQGAMLDIRKRFGKNAILKGTSFQNGATMRERNAQIGGHKA